MASEAAGFDRGIGLHGCRVTPRWPQVLPFRSPTEAAKNLMILAYTKTLISQPFWIGDTFTQLGGGI